MPAVQQLSHKPEAVRKRRQRENQRLAALRAEALARARAELASDMSRVPPPTTTPASQATRRSSSSEATTSTSGGFWETKPVDGPGPEAFAVAAAAPGEQRDTEAGTPFVDGAASSPPPGVTEADATAIATGVVTFYAFGIRTLLEKRAAAAAELGKVVDVEGVLQKTSAMVFLSSKNLCFKYNIRFKYADECIVAGALGVAAFGIACKPDKPGVVGNDNARAKAAKDANARESRRDPRDTRDTEPSNEAARTDEPLQSRPDGEADGEIRLD